jgi:hypothetical protein
MISVHAAPVEISVERIIITAVIIGIEMKPSHPGGPVILFRTIKIIIGNMARLLCRSILPVSGETARRQMYPCPQRNNLQNILYHKEIHYIPDKHNVVSINSGGADFISRFATLSFLS